MQGLQSGQRLECRRFLAQAALADGNRVQEVAVFGSFDGQLLRFGQCRFVSLTLDQRPDPLEFKSEFGTQNL